MKKFNGTLLLLAALLVIGNQVAGQAITAATPFSFAVTGTLANCPAASATIAQYCFTNTGLYQSLDTTSWTLATGAVGPAGPTGPQGPAGPTGPAGSNGVTGIVVCNELGASCGASQTGAVQLDIPKTATLN